MKSRTQLKNEWSDAFKPLLGRKIVKVRYMSDEEMQDADWHQSCVVLQLDDGTLLWPSSDDEGNGAGALFLAPQCKVPEVAPVI
jgi:hypothetical protein